MPGRHTTRGPSPRTSYATRPSDRSMYIVWLIWLVVIAKKLILLANAVNPFRRHAAIKDLCAIKDACALTESDKANTANVLDRGEGVGSRRAPVRAKREPSAAWRGPSGGQERSATVAPAARHGPRHETPGAHRARVHVPGRWICRRP